MINPTLASEAVGDAVDGEVPEGLSVLEPASPEVTIESRVALLNG